MTNLEKLKTLTALLKMIEGAENICTTFFEMSHSDFSSLTGQMKSKIMHIEKPEGFEAFPDGQYESTKRSITGQFKKGGLVLNTEAATEYITSNGGNLIDFSTTLLAINKNLEKQKDNKKYESDMLLYFSDFVCYSCGNKDLNAFLFLYKKKALNRETWECEKCKMVINTRLAPQEEK